MGDLHAMIIYHVRQMVGWVSVGLDQDGIIVHPLDKIQLVWRAVLARLAVHQVIEHRVSLHLQPDDMRFALGRPLFGLVRGDLAAFSIVTCRQTSLAAMSGESVQSVGRAEAAVGVAVLDQLVCVCAVECGAFGLREALSVTAYNMESPPPSNGIPVCKDHTDLQQSGLSYQFSPSANAT